MRPKLQDFLEMLKSDVINFMKYFKLIYFKPTQIIAVFTWSDMGLVAYWWSIAKGEFKIVAAKLLAQSRERDRLLMFGVSFAKSLVYTYIPQPFANGDLAVLH